MIAAEEPAIDLDDPGELTQTEADLPLLGEHDMDEVCCRVLTSGSTGSPDPVGLTYGNFLWSAVGSAFNIGVEPEDRWLCCLPLSHISGLGDRRCARSSTAPPRSLHDGFDVDRVAAALRGGQDHRRLAGGDDADAAAGGRRRPLRPAGDPDRRRAGPEEPLEEAIGRGATVVQTYGLTEACSQVTTLAPAERSASSAPPAGRCSPPTCGSRTARSSSRARPSLPAAPTPTAGCIPATSAASTRRASSTSRTGSTT